MLLAACAAAVGCLLQLVPGSIEIEAHEANYAYGPLLLSLQLRHGGDAWSRPMATLMSFMAKGQPPGVSLAMLPLVLAFGKSVVALRAAAFALWLAAIALAIHLAFWAADERRPAGKAGAVAAAFFVFSPLYLRTTAYGFLPEDVFPLFPGLACVAFYLKAADHGFRRARWLWLAGALVGLLMFARWHLWLSLLGPMLLHSAWQARQGKIPLWRTVAPLAAPTLALVPLLAAVVDLGAALRWAALHDSGVATDVSLAQYAAAEWRTLTTELSPLKLLRDVFPLPGCGRGVDEQFFGLSWGAALCVIGLAAEAAQRSADRRSAALRGFAYLQFVVLWIVGSLMYDRARIAYVDLFFHNMPLLFVLSGLGWSGLLTSAAQKLPARVRFVPAALAVASVGILLVIPAWRLLLHHNRDYAPAVRAWTVAQTRPDFLDGRVALLDASMGALGRSGQPGYLEWLLLPDERWPAPPHEAAPLAVDQQLMADLGLPALDRRAAGLQGLFSKEGADRLERRGFCSLVVLVRRGQVDADGAEIDGAVSALVAQPDWPWTNRAETFFDDANVHGFVLRPPGSAGEP